MKHRVTVFILIAIIVGITSCGSNNAALSEQGKDRLKQVYSTGELNQDFRQFRRIMELKTAGLYTDRDRLRTMLDRAASSIREPMTELEFYRLLAPIVAELRCGHTFLSVSKPMEAYMREEALLFPLTVRFVDDGLFVIDDPHGTGIAPGSEIFSINGTTANEVFRIIASNMSTDGDDRGRPRYDAQRWFAAMYFSYIDTTDSFILEVHPPESTDSIEQTISGVRDASLAKTAQGIMLDTTDTPYSVTFQQQYALLSVPTFSLSRPKQFAEFLSNTFTRIKENRIDTLILDVRGNYGGTPVPTVELFSYLIDKPVPFFAKDNPFYLNRWKKPVEPAPEAFDGDLYVLMDEAGFSMNGFLLSLLDYHGIGTLIGTQSSGGYMCSDASKTATLNTTGLRLRYSTHAFQTAVEGQTPGIGVEPDIRVAWDVENYLEGVDPVLKAALSEAGIR